jgi:hypothetical protein
MVLKTKAGSFASGFFCLSRPIFREAIAFRYLLRLPNRCTMPKPEARMIKAIRTALALVFAVMLLSVVTLAQASGQTNSKTNPKTSPKTKTTAADQQHHSKLSKAAFWHHDKNNTKNAKSAKTVKPAKATKATSKKATTKTAQKSTKTAKVKPVSSKTASGKKSQPKISKTSTKKTASKKTPTKA